MSPPADFEWDDAKAASNLDRHGVPFAFATRIFDDMNRLDAIDTKHSDVEQ